MRVLFVHANAPGQYRHLALALAADPANQVVFLARDGAPGLPGVDVRRFSPHRAVRADAHPYLTSTEQAVLNGQAAWRAAVALKREGFTPDLICAHAGFGPGLYLKQVFPESPLLGYFEWFYHPVGGDADFLLGPLDPDNACRVHTLNAGLLLELSACDHGICPTVFQRSQFPEPFQSKLTVLHDGIDTGFFSPDEAESRRLPDLDLTGAEEVVTYATRGMDPYRGFPQMLRAVADLLERRPKLHVIVAGDDRVPYGPRHPGGKSWKQAMLEELGGRDLARLHFTGPLPLPAYRRLLRLSTVHIYLTVPFVLSWSLLESMSAGCAIVGSDTAPVREVMASGSEGLLVPFQDHGALADTVAFLLDNPDRRRALAKAARDRVLRDYALDRLLPRQLRLMTNMVEASLPQNTAVQHSVLVSKSK